MLKSSIKHGLEEALTVPLVIAAIVITYILSKTFKRIKENIDEYYIEREGW